MIKSVIKKFLNCYRIVILRFRHNTFGMNNVICKGALLMDSVIGSYCYLGMYSYFNHVRMGSYCSIAGNVTIGAMEHDYSDISTSTALSHGGYDDRITEIGNDVWIGAQCVIRQGVRIGTGAVIGANSFVNKDVPPFAIVFGTPAKVYKMRFSDNEIEMILNSQYWEKKPVEALAIIDSIKRKCNEDRI